MFGIDLIIFQTFIGKFLSRSLRQLFTLLQHNVSGFGINQIKVKFNAFHSFRNKLGLPGFFIGNKGINIIEISQNLFFGHSFDFGRVNLLAFFGQLFDFFFGFFGIQRIQDRCYRQFAAAVDTGIQQVFGIKFKIKPGTAVRNNTGCKQIFTGRNGLAFVMVKEHTRRTVHLRNDNAFGTVENKGTFVRHQRNITHINVLFLNVMDRLCPGGFIRIPNHQTQRSLNRSGISHIALNALFHVIFWLFELIFHKFKLTVTGKIFDGKNRFENFFQTEFAFLCIFISFNKAVIRTGLNFD